MNRMNLDLYSDRAKTAIQSAQSLALARRHQQFAPEHLLKVLLEERDGLARNLITAAGGDAAKAEQAVALLQQHLEQMLGRELLMAAGQGEALGGLDRGLGAVGIEVEVHWWAIPC